MVRGRAFVIRVTLQRSAQIGCDHCVPVGNQPPYDGAADAALATGTGYDSNPVRVHLRVDSDHFFRVSTKPAPKTAMSRRAPRTTYCQKVGTPRSDRPLLITPIRRTPTTVPTM